MTTKIQICARIILGLIYFVFGGMGLAIAFGFMPMPAQSMPAAAEEFMKGILGSGYFLPFLKVTETSCGFLLLTGFLTPLALLVLAPITLNIFMFHLNLTPGTQNLILPSIMVIAHVAAMSAYWSLYKPLFSNRKKV
jgi:putative oxidoreductase